MARCVANATGRGVALLRLARFGCPGVLVCDFCVSLHSAVSFPVYVHRTIKTSNSEKNTVKKIYSRKFAPSIMGARHLLVARCFTNAAGRVVVLLRLVRPGVVSSAVCCEFNIGRRPM